MRAAGGGGSGVLQNGPDRGRGHFKRTINGAHALGCADRVGSIEPGKSADLLLLEVSDYRELARQLAPTWFV